MTLILSIDDAMLHPLSIVAMMYVISSGVVGDRTKLLRRIVKRLARRDCSSVA